MRLPRSLGLVELIGNNLIRNLRGYPSSLYRVQVDGNDFIGIVFQFGRCEVHSRNRHPFLVVKTEARRGTISLEVHPPNLRELRVGKGTVHRSVGRIFLEPLSFGQICCADPERPDIFRPIPSIDDLHSPTTFSLRYRGRDQIAGMNRLVKCWLRMEAHFIAAPKPGVKNFVPGKSLPATNESSVVPT